MRSHRLGCQDTNLFSSPGIKHQFASTRELRYDNNKTEPLPPGSSFTAFYALTIIFFFTHHLVCVCLSPSPNCRLPKCRNVCSYLN